MISQKRFKTIIITIALGFILINLIGLDRSPVVWIDEVAMNDPAKELAQHGVLRSSVFAGESGFESVYLWVPPGQPLVIAIVYKIFGFGIWQTRVPVLVFGALLIIALSVLSKRLFQNSLAAMSTAVLFALDPQFVQTARAARMDAQCLLFALIAVMFFLKMKKESGIDVKMLFVSGLMLGCAWLTSPIVSPWGISLALLIFLECKGSPWKSLIAFAMGVLIPCAVWIAYALQTPQAFQEQFIPLVQGHFPKSSIFGRVFEEFERYGHVYQHVPFLLLAYVASLIWMLLSNWVVRTNKIRIFTLFVFPFLFNTFFMNKQGGFYTLHTNIILSITAGVLISYLSDARLHLLTKTKRVLTMLVIGTLFMNVFFVSILGRFITLAYQWDARDYSIVETAVREHIPKGSIVWGAAEIWYAVEENGSTLRVVGNPDPQIHDFVVRKVDQSKQTLEGFMKVKVFGESLPAVLGFINLSSFDYRMEIWKSILRTSRQ